MFFCSILCVNAQQFVYDNLIDLLEGNCNEVDGLVIEHRSRNQISLYGGADYRIIKPEFKSMSNYLKKKCYAVQNDSSLYVNCGRLRYKKLSFGGWYATAMIINGNVFFKAVPLGSFAAQSFKPAKVKLGGEVGDAIAASSLISKRVYYMIEGESGTIYFVGREFMQDLLKDTPDIYQSYLDEDSESADTTEKYLLLLSNNIE